MERAYVHLRDDGAIFVVRGDAHQGWVTQAQLGLELAELKTRGGTLLYSRDHPERDPSPIATRCLGYLLDFELPLSVLSEPHPAVSKGMSDGATALMVFSYRGSVELVLDLLARGADLETRDATGYTALMYAAEAGHEDIVAALLDYTADPSAIDDQGSTPLMFAAQNGHLEVIRQLVNAGAALSARGTHGLTALGFATQNHHEAAASLLRASGAM